jgi:signal transduction histidine kinase
VSSTRTAHRLFAPRRSAAAIIDVAIAAAALVGSLALLAHGGFGFTASEPDSGQFDWISVLLTACATVPLVAWRRSPLGVFVATATASVLLGGLGYPIGLPLGPTAALFLFAASRDEEDPWTGRSTLTVGALFLAYLGASAFGNRGFPGRELFHTGLAWAVAWFAGERTRLRREQMAELRELARRAERDAERERLLAASEERARIARDLHDSVGHAISVIAVRAGAARLRHGEEPDRSLLALEAVEEVARQTVEDIEQIVGTLREGDSVNGVVESPPGLASLDTLIAQREEAGLEVRIDAAGAPRPLGAAADQAAYRILQEALTNAARHGAGSARIELAFGEAAVELTVSNPVIASASPGPGGGHGLVGMEERATVLGGSLEAERANGAFRLRACIPYGGQSA